MFEEGGIIGPKSSQLRRSGEGRQSGREFWAFQRSKIASKIASCCQLTLLLEFIIVKLSLKSLNMELTCDRI